MPRLSECGRSGGRRTLIELRRPRVLLGATVGLAVVVRLAFVAVWPATYDLPDSRSYTAVAENLLAGKGFVVDADTQVGRAPLYPAFLAVSFAVFGHHDLPVFILQALLGALVCIPLWHLGLRMGGNRAARFAAIAAALYPPFVFYTRLVLSEALFIPLLPAAVLGLMALRDQFKLRSAILTGVALGAMVLLRPSAVLFCPYALLVVLAVGRFRKGTVASALVASVVTALVVSPWAIRNYRVTGHAVLGTLTGGWALYEGNSPEATGGPAQHLVRWPTDELSRLDEYARNAYLGRLAIGYIATHQRRFIELTAARVCRMWSVTPNDPQFRTPPAIVVSVATYAPLVVLAVVGVGLTLGWAWRAWVIVCCPVLYYSVLHAVTVGSVRYRDPLMFAFIVGAAVAVVLLAKLLRSVRGDRIRQSG